MTTRADTTVQALVLVDLQRDYFQDPRLCDLEDDLVESAMQLAERAHEAGALVVEVRTVHDPRGSTWALNMRDDAQGLALAGTQGVEPLEGLDLDSTVVVKTRDSAFHLTELERLLARHGVTALALGGVSTESCVLATATDAYAHDLRVVLVEDVIGCVDDAWHRRSLHQLHERFRQPIVRAAEVRFEQAAHG